MFAEASSVLIFFIRFCLIFALSQICRLLIFEDTAKMKHDLAHFLRLLSDRLSAKKLIFSFYSKIARIF